jgi:predicted DNA-binding protein
MTGSQAPEQTTIIARLPVTLREALAELAKRNERTLSQELRRALQAHVTAERDREAA